MLILTRRIGETLLIGDRVTVTVPDAKGNQVRLGISAPKEVAVHPEEVFERIKQERAERALKYSYCRPRRIKRVFGVLPLESERGQTVPVVRDASCPIRISPIRLARTLRSNFFPA
jgi:carbon storage regulator